MNNNYNIDNTPKKTTVEEELDNFFKYNINGKYNKDDDRNEYIKKVYNSYNYNYSRGEKND